mgnify:CR=1 FL=1
MQSVVKFIQKTVIISCLCLPLSTMASTPSTAYSNTTYNQNYLTASIGFFEIYSMTDPLDKQQTSRPITYAIALGHQITTKWALEASFTRAKLHNQSGYNSYVNYTSLLARYQMLHGQHVNIYSKIGVGYFSLDNRSDPAPMLGLGMNWHLTKHFDLNIDATGPTLGFITLANVSAGLSLKF